MKKGKLIIFNNIFWINYNQNPSIVLDENINEDGSKELNSTPKWNPFKFTVIDYESYKLINANYNDVFLIPDKENNIFKLKNCFYNSEKYEFVFDYATLYQ